MNCTDGLIDLFRKARFIAALGFFGILISANAQDIKVGYFELQPRSILGKAGNAEGSAIERFIDIAKNMGMNPVFVYYPFARMMFELEHQNIDVALIMGKSPEREAKFYYPTLPFYTVHAGLIVRTGSPLTTIKSSEDLKPFNVGAMLGAALTPTMRDDGIRKEFLAGENFYIRNIEKLLLNRIDAVYASDQDEARMHLKALGKEKEARVIALPDPPTKLFNVFNKEKGVLWGEKYLQALEAVTKEKGDYGGKAP